MDFIASLGIPHGNLAYRQFGDVHFDPHPNTRFPLRSGGYTKPKMGYSCRDCEGLKDKPTILT